LGKRGGPKPKPAAFKVLHGNPGKREIPPEPKAYGTLVAPEWLDGEALAKWNQIAPELERTMGAAALDSDSLAAYCFAWATFVRLRKVEDIVWSDKGSAYQNPQVGLRNKSLEQMRKFGAVLGLSPSDRVGIPSQDKFAADPAAEFIA
jgi:P27 family predicted phage terminase small subunit